MVKIKIKKIGKDSKLPTRMKEGDAGFDAYINGFRSVSIKEKRKIIKWITRDYKEAYLSQFQRIICDLGFATEIPKGYYAQIVPRSGLALWEGLTVLNAPATIDSGYRGEIGVIVYNASDDAVRIEHGERVAQIVLNEVPQIQWSFVDELSETERGVGGFGSTGAN